MIQTHGYARNKEQDMLEGTEQSVGQQARRIASARAGFGLISAGGASICNCGTRGNGLLQHFSRNPTVQFLSAFLN